MPLQWIYEHACKRPTTICLAEVKLDESESEGADLSLNSSHVRPSSTKFIRSWTFLEVWSHCSHVAATWRNCPGNPSSESLSRWCAWLKRRQLSASADGSGIIFIAILSENGADMLLAMIACWMYNEIVMRDEGEGNLSIRLVPSMIPTRWSCEQITNALNLFSPGSCVCLASKGQQDRLSPIALPRDWEVFCLNDLVGASAPAVNLDCLVSPPHQDVSDAPALVLFTSGTTGESKPIRLTMQSLLVNQRAVQNLFDSIPCPNGESVWGPDAVSLILLPLSHGFALTSQFFRSLYNGGQSIVLLATDGRVDISRGVLRCIAELQVTHLCLVPWQWEQFLRFASTTKLPHRAFSSLQRVFLGGAPITDILLRLMEDYFSSDPRPLGASWPKLHSLLGTTETSGTILVSRGVALDQRGSMHRLHADDFALCAPPDPSFGIRMVPLSTVNPSGLTENEDYALCVPTDCPLLSPDCLWQAAAGHVSLLDSGDRFRLAEESRSSSVAELPSRGWVYNGRSTERWKNQQGLWINAFTTERLVIEASEGCIRNAFLCRTDDESIGKLILELADPVEGLEGEWIKEMLGSVNSKLAPHEQLTWEAVHLLKDGSRLPVTGKGSLDRVAAARLLQHEVLDSAEKCPIAIRPEQVQSWIEHHLQSLNALTLSADGNYRVGCLSSLQAVQLKGLLCRLFPTMEPPLRATELLAMRDSPLSKMIEMIQRRLRTSSMQEELGKRSGTGRTDPWKDLHGSGVMTVAEAKQFLERWLRIPFLDPQQHSDPLQRLRFLDRVGEQFLICVPFQSLTVQHWHTEAGLKHGLPSPRQIVEAMLQKPIGGLCYVMNVFYRELLCALGFDAIYARATLHGLEDCHVTILIKNLLTLDDLWSVDVGSGYPMPYPMPIEHSASPAMRRSLGSLKVHLDCISSRDPDGLGPRVEKVRRLQFGDGDGEDETQGGSQSEGHLLWELIPRPTHLPTPSIEADRVVIDHYLSYTKLRMSRVLEWDPQPTGSEAAPERKLGWVYLKADFVPNQGWKCCCIIGGVGELGTTKRSCTVDELRSEVVHYFGDWFSATDFEGFLKTANVKGAD
jgi:acyl-CoA synthetase (AMP-forming)/AMP-acid ligase II